MRLRGDYVGIATLAFGEIIGQVASNGRDIELFGGSLTGGPQGMSAIDRIELPFLERFGSLGLRPWYWLALALVALMLFVNLRLRDSRIGRAWTALRDDEDAAANAGVPIVRTKLMAYGVGAALGGVSGAFLAPPDAPDGRREGVRFEGPNRAGEPARPGRPPRSPTGRERWIDVPESDLSSARGARLGGP